MSNHNLKNIYIYYHENGHAAIGLRVEIEGLVPGRGIVRGDGYAGSFLVGHSMKVFRGDLLFFETTIEDPSVTATDLIYHISSDQWPQALRELRARLCGDVPDAGFGTKLSGSMLTVRSPGKESVTSSNTFCGMSARRARIEVTIGASTWNTSADDSGHWTLIADGLASAAHTATVTAHDEHGDSSKVIIPFTLDSTAASLTLTSPTEGSTTAANLFAGTAAADASVTVIVGEASWTTTSDGAGSWSLQATGLASGAVRATITAADSAGRTASTSVRFTLDTVQARATRAANRVLRALAEAGTIRCLTDPLHFDEKPDSDNPHIVAGALLCAMSVSHHWIIESALEQAEHGRPSNDLLKYASIVRSAIERAFSWLQKREVSPGYFLRWAQHDHPEIDWALRSRYEEHNWTAEPSLDEYSGLISGLKWATHMRTCPHEPDGKPFLDNIGAYLRGTHTFLLRPVTRDLTMRGPDIIVNSYPLLHSVGAGEKYPLKISSELRDIVDTSDAMRNRMSLDESFCKFLATDFRDLGAAARVLVDSSNEVAALIHGNLSADTRTMLAEVATAGSTAGDLTTALVHELNSMIAAPEDQVSRLFGRFATLLTTTSPKTRRWLIRVTIFDTLLFKDHGVVWQHLASQYNGQVKPLKEIIDKWEEVGGKLRLAKWVAAIGLETALLTVLGPIGLLGIPVLLGAISYVEGEIEELLETFDSARIWKTIGAALSSEAGVAAGHYNIPIFDRYSIAASWAGDSVIREAFSQRATRRVDVDGDDAWPIYGMACRVWFGAFGSIDGMLRAMLDRLDDLPEDAHVLPEASIKTMEGFVAAWAMICATLDMDPDIHWREIFGAEAPAPKGWRRVASRTTCCVSPYSDDGNRFWMHQRNGRVLCSSNVPEGEYQGLVHAGSFDAYFDQRLRGHYACDDVSDTPEIQLIPVQSSWIAALGYDHDTQTLRVELLSGGTYSFDGVPAETYDAFLAAESKGEYFNENILGKYD